MASEVQSPDSITTAVITAIADAKSVQPIELDVVLQNHMDVDTLESLAAVDNSSWTLTFELLQHTVTVTGDGVVRIDGVVENVWET